MPVIARLRISSRTWKPKVRGPKGVPSPSISRNTAVALIYFVVAFPRTRLVTWLEKRILKRFAI
ncbi:hypothetical protein MR829_23090 [Paracoccus versutus]|uniref:hypothetical protein n=1 Tax=Paracoccus versutus TaxID=34007 RepID=UPI00091E09AE|nr:hypothetical protein [Paracoccus versutus]MCJ1903216.1 hypothetical protein [Paracoccus versutus]MDF3907678.1 hypothetical protein [Paracoccus sp. AS002]SFY45592.1 hypothetical protein SAMN04244548_05278 [Paracoccus pantotrophus]